MVKFSPGYYEPFPSHYVKRVEFGGSKIEKLYVRDDGTVQWVLIRFVSV